MTAVDNRTLALAAGAAYLLTRQRPPVSAPPVNEVVDAGHLQLVLKDFPSKTAQALVTIYEGGAVVSMLEKQANPFTLVPTNGSASATVLLLAGDYHVKVAARDASGTVLSVEEVDVTVHQAETVTVNLNMQGASFDHLDDQIAALQAQLQEVLGSNQALSGQLTQLDQQTTAAQTSLTAALNALVSAEKTALAQASSAVGSIITSGQSAQDKLAAIQNNPQASKVSGDIAAVQQDLAAVLTAAGTAQASLEQVADDIAQSAASVQDALDLVDRIEQGIVAAMSTLSAQHDQIVGAQSQIDALQVTVNRLRAGAFLVTSVERAADTPAAQAQQTFTSLASGNPHISRQFVPILNIQLSREFKGTSPSAFGSACSQYASTLGALARGFRASVDGAAYTGVQRVLQALVGVPSIDPSWYTGLVHSGTVVPVSVGPVSGQAKTFVVPFSQQVSFSWNLAGKFTNLVAGNESWDAVGACLFGADFSGAPRILSNLIYYGQPDRQAPSDMWSNPAASGKMTFNLAAGVYMVVAWAGFDGRSSASVDYATLTF